MKSLHLKLKGGKLAYDQFNIDPTKYLEEQIWNLDEDLIQITFDGGKYIVDVGWYPSFNVNGEFIIYVIENLNWENPLLIKKTNNFKQLNLYIQECIDFVNNLIKVN
jgi:hypothetical protein